MNRTLSPESMPLSTPSRVKSRHDTRSSTLCALFTVVAPLGALTLLLMPSTTDAPASQPCHWQTEAYSPLATEQAILRHENWQAWCPTTCDPAATAGSDTPACEIPPLPTN